MAKSKRRGSISSKSKKQRSGSRPAKSNRAGPQRPEKRTIRLKHPSRASRQLDVSRPVTASRLPGGSGESTQPIRTATRVGASPPTASGQSDAGMPPAGHESGRETRTLLPPLIPGELEEINLFGGRAKQNRARILEEKAGRFQRIQDFLHNPHLFDLRGKENELTTSSTPEEIEARTGEIRYQIEVLHSLLSVLTEELNALEQARPQLGTDQNTSTSVVTV
jgi:hypothetical protein